MPNWLINQLRTAFAHKNRYKVKLLNQCWFYYQKKEYPKQTSRNI
ncbi:cortex morphogenetic protein CmpA [Halalkalibacterium halodurans]|nr:cortex morphogenetic protein CmpA [Halalkalibacterium halodurans]MDY7221029.1 cortex morphogenetic protein CmpA [Halalkalibacterium halodurans]MDY7240268.1 cortex morphogenetic protein CmpA [Halalkalibacterium halodurans]MED3645869.1 cortex morphogenetic protein CmpA [Halalkalibacterium halodurans]MED4079919.1 cortex morphogenetic protein CmpA [Halalkalibacterium halodurans]MED4085262.1 cortex morphogenetic protein CmpA [Halalkalibacterium halodurans]